MKLFTELAMRCLVHIGYQCTFEVLQAGCYDYQCPAYFVTLPIVKRWNIQQVVKIVCHKVASPPHLDGSVVFARWHQRAPI